MLIGRAFDTLYVDKIVNQCDKHDAGSSNVTWKYNADNPLPACIRELDLMIWFILIFIIFSILCEHNSARSTWESFSCQTRVHWCSWSSCDLHMWDWIHVSGGPCESHSSTTNHNNNNYNNRANHHFCSLDLDIIHGRWVCSCDSCNWPHLGSSKIILSGSWGWPGQHPHLAHPVEVERCIWNQW